MKVTIGTAARELGVTVQTVRDWDRQGKIQSVRTMGGHRRYDLDELKKLRADPREADHE